MTLPRGDAMLKRLVRETALAVALTLQRAEHVIGRRPSARDLIETLVTAAIDARPANATRSRGRVVALRPPVPPSLTLNAALTNVPDLIRLSTRLYGAADEDRLRLTLSAIFERGIAELRRDTA